MSANLMSVTAASYGIELPRSTLTWGLDAVADHVQDPGSRRRPPPMLPWTMSY
jgi:hypothetical protein